MKKHHLTIEHPESLLAALNLSQEDFEWEARMARAAKLFELKRVFVRRGRAVGGR